jgi:hypothetical protein
MLVNEIAPRIRSGLGRLAPPVGAEDPEELAQDTVAMAAGILHSAQLKGKTVTPGKVAYYAMRLASAGRRSTGSGRTDVMHPGTQLHGRSRLRSMEDPVCSEEGTDEPLVLASEAEDPAVTGARNLDWQALWLTLDERKRTALHCLVEGRPLTEAALALGISRTGARKLKKKLKAAVAEFLGADALAQVQKLPRWKDNLQAARERVACRVERQAA